jgi:predicted acylesterase/phospholipase RssA
MKVQKSTQSLIPRVAIVLAATAALQACGTVARLDPVPANLVGRAVTPGIPNSRYWEDVDLSPLIQYILDDDSGEREALSKAGLPTDPLPPAHLLAISGGGDSGAFAAGLLVGWTAHGDRPKFRVVTGISAGALIAPFAYLGSEYDSVLRSVATSIDHDGLFRPRGLLAGLSNDGMADSAPLAQLVANYVTPAVLAAIAAEHRKGRALMIGTTDLDSGRAVAWNMGIIAASPAPTALDLFRKVMLASASIPGAVSPVMIDVEAEGKRYQEMHVDGGVVTQVFTHPSNSLTKVEQVLGRPYRREIHVYAIRNGKIDPDWSATPRRTINIGTRAISVLLQRQGISDLERIYRTAERDHADFNLAYIGADFVRTEHEQFDPAYMRRLFDYGYQLSMNGYPWRKKPPVEADR